MSCIVTTYKRDLATSQIPHNLTVVVGGDCIGCDILIYGCRMLSSVHMVRCRKLGVLRPLIPISLALRTGSLEGNSLVEETDLIPERAIVCIN
jgi:hypothetical protein